MIRLKQLQGRRLARCRVEVDDGVALIVVGAGGIVERDQELRGARAQRGDVKDQARGSGDLVGQGEGSCRCGIRRKSGGREIRRDHAGKGDSCNIRADAHAVRPKRGVEDDRIAQGLRRSGKVNAGLVGCRFAKRDRASAVGSRRDGARRHAGAIGQDNATSEGVVAVSQKEIAVTVGDTQRNGSGGRDRISANLNGTRASSCDAECAGATTCRIVCNNSCCGAAQCGDGCVQSIQIKNAGAVDRKCPCAGQSACRALTDRACGDGGAAGEGVGPGEGQDSGSGLVQREGADPAVLQGAAERFIRRIACRESDSGGSVVVLNRAVTSEGEDGIVETVEAQDAGAIDGHGRIRAERVRRTAQKNGSTRHGGGTAVSGCAGSRESDQTTDVQGARACDRTADGQR